MNYSAVKWLNWKKNPNKNPTEKNPKPNPKPFDTSNSWMDNLPIYIWKSTSVCSEYFFIKWSFAIEVWAYLTISKLETSFLNLCFFLCSFHGVHEEGTKAIDGITNVLPKWKWYHNIHTFREMKMSWLGTLLNKIYI